MVNLPIHDNVSGLNVVWNLYYITILDTIHVKKPTEHGNWLYIYILGPAWASLSVACLE